MQLNWKVTFQRTVIETTEVDIQLNPNHITVKNPDEEWLREFAKEIAWDNLDPYESVWNRAPPDTECIGVRPV